MIMFMRLETSGLIRRELPLDDERQPWMVRISAETTTLSGNRLCAMDHLIKSEGRSIKDKAQKIHGIDATTCDRYGVSERPILALLADMAGTVESIVTYTQLDLQIIDSLMVRLAVAMKKKDINTYLKRFRRPGLVFLHLQTPAAQIECGLKAGDEDGFKWPTFDEARQHILGDTTQIQTSFDRLRFLREMFFALKAKGHFEEIAHDRSAL